ncbi:hypothetical protein SAMN06297387_11094 [Streptomyces zhaozhouensis]|uniref:Tetratricopeptide repeat-containing protein n=1 Tax=Streptomyces zhaozhouensis TaxID=1300267 RepID=A0A286DXI0_9ACTN|nr:hypothetical protein [Streptomyces zhaozhouensis]SOD63362.1 hypothetical protein SAMN06297387_11094 [Streptomyces zhaozhouensis]
MSEETGEVRDGDEPLGLKPTVPSSPRWHRWRDLHREGTELLAAGRFAEADARLREAVAETRVADVDAEGLLHRARSLANLAGVAEGTGGAAEAERLSGEAIGLCRGLLPGAEGSVPTERPVPAAVRTDAALTLVNTLTARAQTRTLAGLPELVEADLDEAFAVAGELAEPPPQLLVFSLHGARTGQFMLTGLLAEAEQEALLALDIALAHHPELAAYPCDNLARMALACGNPEGAEQFRAIAADPHAFSAELSEEAPHVERFAVGSAESMVAGPAAVVWPLAPRWRRCTLLNAEGVRLALAGRLEEADQVLAAAERATRTVGGGLDTLVCRAGVLLNRVGVAESTGDLGNALALADEAIALLERVVAEAPDDGRDDGGGGGGGAGPGDGTGGGGGQLGQLLGARNLRAALLRESGRHAAALAELDRVEAASPALGDAERPTVEVWALLLRATVASALGRLAEADAAGRAALALAQERVPALTPRIHVLLADLAGTLGDTSTSEERFALAGELFAVLGDAGGEAATLASLGRNAYLAGDWETADARFARAEALVTGEGHAAQLAACRLGRAAVAVSSGRAAAGLDLLDTARAALGAEATPLRRIAFHQVRGGALAALGRFPEADDEVLAARRLAEESQGWHVALTLDWWRADAHARWAASLPPDERGPVLERALATAVPAALAAEAARQFFAAGGDRERWVALAAAPALRAALLATRNAGRPTLAVALLDHLTATASLSADAREGAVPTPGASAPPDVTDVPLPRHEPLTGDRLSYAAAALGLATGGDPAFPAPRLALPPRVRVVPGTPSELEPWMERAEQVYGFPVRAPEAVRAW